VRAIPTPDGRSRDDGGDHEQRRARDRHRPATEKRRRTEQREHERTEERPHENDPVAAGVEEYVLFGLCEHRFLAFDTRR
jgi:hypothetical protein